MATQSDVASRIVATLAITEPDLDTAVGSVTRKIVDAVAQQMADSYVDDHLLTYQYDIDSKIEADLDDFVQNFGISRIAAKRATGVVVFQRGSGDTSTAVGIPVNTQIASSLSGTAGQSVVVQTVTPGFMGIGVSSVEVPVQAVEPGLAGNVGAGLLTRFRTPVTGVLSVTNVQPLIGGVGQETDSELRARWKRTVFRSLAGTEAMYLGIALNHENCFGANVLGATKTYSEQIQILPPPVGAGPEVKGVGVSSLNDVLFAYAETALMGPHLAGSQVLLRGHDFEIDTTVRPPRITMLIDDYITGNTLESGAAETASVIGAIFDLTYEYAPKDSRNLPAQGITNRVDIWCAGVKAATATQSVIFSPGKRFVADYGSPYWVYNFVRKDRSAPAVNNIFIPLAFGPIIEVPETLAVGGGTYHLNEHYWLVHDDTPFGYTATSRFGLEWAATSIPAGLNPVFIVGENDDYTYNQMIEDIQGGIERWRLTGIDAQAHQAKLHYLRFNIAVMYDRGATPEIVNGQIENAIQNYLHGLTFGSTVQASDVLAAIHATPGVDNVRFLDARDWLTYSAADVNSFGVGIQRVVLDNLNRASVAESYVNPATGEALDITFGDSEIPVYESFRGDRLASDTGQAPSGVPAVRAQNTFWTGINQSALAGGSGGPSGPAVPSAPVITNYDSQTSGHLEFDVTSSILSDPTATSLVYKEIIRDSSGAILYTSTIGTAAPGAVLHATRQISSSYGVPATYEVQARDSRYSNYGPSSVSRPLAQSPSYPPASNLTITNIVYGPNPSGSGPNGWMATYNWVGGNPNGEFVHYESTFSDGSQQTGTGGISYDSSLNPAAVQSGWRGFVVDSMPTSTTQSLSFFLGVPSDNINSPLYPLTRP